MTSEISHYPMSWSLPRAYLLQVLQGSSQTVSIVKIMYDLKLRDGIWRIDSGHEAKLDWYLPLDEHL